MAEYNTLELLADPACPSIVCALQGSHKAAGLVFAFVSLCFEKQSIVYIPVFMLLALKIKDFFLFCNFAKLLL